jgi:hypothetical protein
MARHSTLLAWVRNNPRDVRFSDLLTLLLTLAEAFGFEFLRHEGSHRHYVHRATGIYLNLQPAGHGKAKPYQVRRFLAEVDAHGLRLKEE